MLTDPGPRRLLRDQLARDEGVVLHGYLDSLGFLTLGIGRLIDERRGGGITLAEAHYLLDNDIDSKLAEVMATFPEFSRLDDARQGVLLAMAFNMGTAGLAAFRNTLAAVWRGDYEAASRGMLQSRWAKQVGARADRLAKQMRTGQWA
jgi:lysozyme